jgi:hypothetical protein
MKVLAFPVLLFLSHLVVGQKMFESQSVGCPVKFVMEDSELIINYEPNDSLMVVDFLAGLEPKQVEKFRGVIMLQVMIDTIGGVCCVSFTNKSNFTDKKLDIPNRIKVMPGWKRELDIMKNENISTMVNLMFNENEITVSRIGYNRNSGKKQLSNTVFNRKKEVAVLDSLPK